MIPSLRLCKMYEFLISHTRATFCDILALLGTITAILVDEEQKYAVPHYAVSSVILSLLTSNIVFMARFSNSLCIH